MCKIDKDIIPKDELEVTQGSIHIQYHTAEADIDMDEVSIQVESNNSNCCVDSMDELDESIEDIENTLRLLKHVKVTYAKTLFATQDVINLKDNGEYDE